MMDTSETYIKMCQKATEIQAQHRELVDILNGVYKQLKDDQRTSSESTLNLTWRETTAQLFEHAMASDGTWLPRQDQLQEMFDLTVCNIYGLTRMFLDFIPGHSEKWTFEQLWLAFVMAERYQKRWTGEGWA